MEGRRGLREGGLSLLLGAEAHLDEFGVVAFHHDLAELLPWSDQDLRAVAAQIPRRWLDAYGAHGTSTSNAVSPLEALERVEAAGGVVRLEHLELVPGYRRRVEEIVHEAAAMFTPSEAVTRHTSVVYVGAGTSRAPWHFDLHHNLFVHLAGTKRFMVGRMTEPRSQHHLVVRRLSGALGPVPELDQVKLFELRLGDALYIPPFTFHSIENLDTTVSVACSWSTPASMRAVRLQHMNGRLGRLGLRTRAPGRRRSTEAAKLALDRLIGFVR
ncbi:MAG: cupin-like domain-containing protein [Acidimicrobiales bacterium]